MKIDEAIEHAEEIACGNDQCAKDHAQLADWLRELRRARMEIDLLKTLRDGFKADAQKYEAENAKLRDAMYTKAGKHALQHMDEDELRIWATQQAELIDELRELVRIMTYCMHDERECDECAMNGADMNVEINQLLACDELYRRIMEVVD